MTCVKPNAFDKVWQGTRLILQAEVLVSGGQVRCISHGKQENLIGFIWGSKKTIF